MGCVSSLFRLLSKKVCGTNRWLQQQKLSVSSAFFDKITKQITCHIGVSK